MQFLKDGVQTIYGHLVIYNAQLKLHGLTY